MCSQGQSSPASTAEDQKITLKEKLIALKYTVILQSQVLWLEFFLILEDIK